MDLYFIEKKSEKGTFQFPVEHFQALRKTNSMLMVKWRKTNFVLDRSKKLLIYTKGKRSNSIQRITFDKDCSIEQTQEGKFSNVLVITSPKLSQDLTIACDNEIIAYRVFTMINELLMEMRFEKNKTLQEPGKFSDDSGIDKSNCNSKNIIPENYDQEQVGHANEAAKKIQTMIRKRLACVKHQMGVKTYSNMNLEMQALQEQESKANIKCKAKLEEKKRLDEEEWPNKVKVERKKLEEDKKNKEQLEAFNKQNEETEMYYNLILEMEALKEQESKANIKCKAKLEEKKRLDEEEWPNKVKVERKKLEEDKKNKEQLEAFNKQNEETEMYYNLILEMEALKEQACKKQNLQEANLEEEVGEQEVLLEEAEEKETEIKEELKKVDDEFDAIAKHVTKTKQARDDQELSDYELGIRMMQYMMSILPEEGEEVLEERKQAEDMKRKESARNLKKQKKKITKLLTETANSKDKINRFKKKKDDALKSVKEKKQAVKEKMAQLATVTEAQKNKFRTLNNIGERQVLEK